MKILFVGGTGNISSAVTDLLLERGVELHLLTRGTRGSTPRGTQAIVCSIADEASVANALGNTHYDVVVNWIAFTPDDIQRDLRLFSGRTAQYVFISSASCYEKPPKHYVITEETPLSNPYWEYSRLKIACEETLWKAYADQKFPVTIVRPSLTYGDEIIPLPT